MPGPSPLNPIRSCGDDVREESDSGASGNSTGSLMRLALEALPDAERFYLMSASPTVLDWGCGSGSGTAAISSVFPGARVSGLDRASAAVDRARKNHPGIEFLLSPEGHIPRPFDVIFASERLAQFPSPIETAAEHLSSCRMFYAILSREKESFP